MPRNTVNVRFYRHGKSDVNDPDIKRGDPKLDPTWSRQHIAQAGRRMVLADYQPQLLLTGPQKRLRQTAERMRRAANEHRSQIGVSRADIPNPIVLDSLKSLATGVGDVIYGDPDELKHAVPRFYERTRQFIEYVNDTCVSDIMVVGSGGQLSVLVAMAQGLDERHWATSQDFINWSMSPKLLARMDYLANIRFLFHQDGTVEDLGNG